MGGPGEVIVGKFERLDRLSDRFCSTCYTSRDRVDRADIVNPTEDDRVFVVISIRVVLDGASFSSVSK